MTRLYLPAPQVPDSIGDLVAPTRLRFDHHRPDNTNEGTLVIGGTGATPTLSWQIATAPQGWEHSKAEIEITRTPAPGGASAPRDAQVFTIETTSSAHIPWPDTPLTSRERATCRVRSAGSDGAWSPWSEPATVETGPLAREDWSAQAIIAPGNIRTDPAPVLVRRFTLDEAATDGRLAITAGGIYEAYIDGQKIGVDELAPGWTEYSQRIVVSTHALPALDAGDHELAIVLGNGWQRGKLTWTLRTEVYGDDLWALAQADFVGASGAHTRVATDDQWAWRPSNVLANDLYDGQRQDLRLPYLGDPAAEQPVAEVDFPDAALVPAILGLPTVIGEISAVEVLNTPSGQRVVDLGQNIVGHVRLEVSGGAAGDEVTLRHAEVMEHDELGVRPLRGALATDTVILAGSGTAEAPEVFTPTLTQHGFRYVEVTGFPGSDEDLLQAVRGRVVSADMDQAAWLTSSEPLIDKLVENTRWSTIDNFITIPTDCPQRDERLGWTGDIGAFAPSALSLYDSSAFLRSWCIDMAAAQGEDGGIPVVIPDVLGGPKLTCAWGDAIVLVPWALWQASGDRRILEENIEAMAAFIRGVEAVAGESLLWRGGFQFGDWLDPDASPHNPADAKADPDVVATAYFAHSSRLVARAFEALGRGDQAKEFHDLSDRVRQAFLDAFVTADGWIISDCATVYSQALAWDLLDTDRRRMGAGARLADLVRGRAFRISTGFVGTPLVPLALVKGGQASVATRLVLERGNPSWLYPVTMGATSIWERWDSMLPDGTINAGEMTSFNHYALGAVTQWILDAIGGLEVTAPAGAELRIAPLVGNGFISASLVRQLPTGLARVEWELEGSELCLRGTIPVGSRATIEVAGHSEVLGHGTFERSFTIDEGGAETGTIRALVDCPDTWEALVNAAKAGGHPIFAGDAAAALAKALSHELDSDPAVLPAAATTYGFIPGLEATREALAKVVTQE
ncbi:MAG: family 78 glycoside hydrolase catalytic domain [Actinomycetaceae bacterium]|nr:family 78 glycoside hydrolase catalytic domain [Actinomycetaceae bacterium]